MRAVDGIYSANAGTFGMLPNAWYACRETFHDTINDGLEFFYICNVASPGSPQDIADFIGKVEDHLDIGRKTIFEPTTSKSIVWINVSPWWAERHDYAFMRYQFFSCCLRAALMYEGKDWRQILLSYKYLYLTSMASERFLAGYTRYVRSNSYMQGGWYRHFTGYDLNRSLTKKEINAMLQKPVGAEAQRIIERAAYFKWLKAGMPSGLSDRFWNEANLEYTALMGQ